MVIALGLLACSATAAQAAQGPVDLAGHWRFQLDREDKGIAERWFERTFPGRIRLPGALQNQGFGDDITVDTKWTGEVGIDRWLQGTQYAKYRQPGNLKIPFFLQPQKHYVGTAWYQRDFEAPTGWEGRRVVLTLERPHWETRVWVDAESLGSRDSLGTPHVYDLGCRLAPGRHRLTIRVDNRVQVDVGAWSHSVSDHTQGNWNGLVGRLELSTTSPVWLEDVQAHPILARKSVLLKVRVGNRSGRPGRGELRVGEQTVAVQWDERGGAAEFEVPLGPKAGSWDEFTPRLHKLTVQLHGEEADDQRTVTVGLREVGTKNHLFTINGRNTYFRGTLECCIFPLTGYPPTEVGAWKRILRICKEHGLNHIRFHSWCPPEAAFIAADELGFYYQVECGVWTNPGDGKPIDQWIYEESQRIVRAYGNHPSFVLLTHGNEPHGPGHEAFLAKWVESWKQRDARRLYTSGSAYPQLPENQYHVYHPCRGPHGWVGRDYRKDVEKLEAPVIVHEMGQWCVYPNFDETRKYTGPLKPRNFEIFRDSLAEHGLLDQWRAFLRASGKLQTLCYKEEIEAAFRTPGISGVQLLDLHDFPGQGTALVGVLDAFWEQKGYVTPAEFRRFYGPTVPLARMAKRVWTTDETLTAEVEVAHFGAEALPETTGYWRLVDAREKLLVQGELPARMIPVDRGTVLGRITVDLARLDTPAKCKLVVGLRGTPFENDWTLWVYSPKTDSAAPAGVLVTSAFDAATTARLEAGGRVVLFPGQLSREHPRGSFTPIFWNRYMFNSQACQTLGLLCDPRHPALERFPTEAHTDSQWEDLLAHSQAVVMDELPRALRPIVQVIDDWNTNRKLGLIFECRVGAGSLLVCSADLERDLERRPAARQLRASLLAYAAGTSFEPKVAVKQEILARLLERKEPSTLVRLGARVVSVDSEDTENGNVAAKAIDGDPNTIWHTRWQPRNDPMPHQLIVDLQREVTIKGITCLPRQDQANGRIAACDVYGSLKPDAWPEPAASAKWEDTGQLQTVRFREAIRVRYLKVVIRSEVHGNPFASLAELDALVAAP